MSLTTFSLFYFGHLITTDNNKLNFDEGGAELTAELNPGSYSLTDFCAEIKRAMDVAGALTYTVTLNRTTRVITIAAGSNFSLLTFSGSHVGVDAFSLIGFSGADKTGAATYSGSAASGSAYTPQFILQDYVGPEDLQKAVDATVNTTASGKVEVVRFGTESFYEMNIRFATDIVQPSIGPITSNTSGVANLRTLMQYLRTKAPVEFMPNSAVPGTFDTLILESTPEDNRGIGYRLKERYDLGIPGYFDTGILKFRVVE